MKTFTMILLTVLAATVNKCSSDSKEMKENLVIEYEAKTRGSFSKVIIKNDSLVVMEEGRNESINYYPLSNKDWDMLVKQIQKIDKKKIKDYKAPTSKRFSDAARAASVRVIYNNETYQSEEFDEGTPPKEIKTFVDTVTGLYMKNKTKK
ncbi:MAG: hypothetical protein WCY89_03790 [Flavobacteriaceae bacterium]